MRAFALTLAFALLLPLSLRAADAPPSAVGSVLKLLQSGRVPEKNLGTIIKMIGERGNEHDLAFLLDQVLTSDKFAPAVKVQMLESLATAATTRKLQPADHRDGIATLLAPAKVQDPKLKLAAIRLAGLWKVTSAAVPLHDLAVAADSSTALREAALASLTSLGPEFSKKTTLALTAADQPFAVRSLAVAALAQQDLDAAVKLATDVLLSAKERDDPARLMDAFLGRQGGPEKLAAALESRPPSTDTAKLCLRHMYAVGRSDAGLQAALGKLAGVETNPKPLSKEEAATLMAEVEQHGDAARGEQVFRRSDLSCMKCHAVSKAGGQVGPDLSGIGASSPMEYLVHSVFDPDQAIKEAYISKTVITVDGQTFSGIVADRSDSELKLKNADGREIAIPLADIDEEIEGKSLMPKGLPSLMTKGEIVDLVKFLSMLGRPGEYEVRSTARMQRWRVFAKSDSLGAEIPDTNTFKVRVLEAENWVPIYATTSGKLPLADAARIAESPFIYLKGELDVVEAGPVEVALDSTDGVLVWVDGNEHPDLSTPLELTPGRHSIILRVETAKRASPLLKLEVRKPADSAAQFNVVDGQ